MSLTKIKPAGFTVKERLKSLDLNAIDANIENAVDKRAGQSDTVLSNLEFQGDIYLTEDSSFTIQQEAVVLLPIGNPASTLSVRDGGNLTISSDANVIVNSNANINMNGTSTMTIYENANLTVANAGGLSLSFAGALTTSTPGAIKLGGGSTDFIALNNPRTREHVFFPTVAGDFDLSGVTPRWRNVGMQYLSSDGIGAAFYCEIPVPDYAQGATISNVYAQYVSSPHSPGVPASLFVRRMPYGSTAIDELNASPADFAYASGSSLQTLNYTTSQFNVIDTSAYRYFLYVLEEYGASSSFDLTKIYNFKVKFSNITSLRF